MEGAEANSIELPSASLQQTEKRNHHLRYLFRPPAKMSLMGNPGLRHSSRIGMPPRPFISPIRHSSAQLLVFSNTEDNHLQGLLNLLEAKNLFAKQIPMMGKAYITRLVYDFNAETCVVLHNGIITAAITSRLFPSQAFCEIVFCAVESSSQGCGYGKLVMDFTKTVCQFHSFDDIITCADNDAVGYFKKQGFCGTKIQMDPKRWVGRIKDYDGVTLVHAKVYPVDYMSFGTVVLRQLNHLIKLLDLKFLQLPPKFLNFQPLYEYQPSILSVGYDVMTKLAPHVDFSYYQDLAFVTDGINQIMDILEADPKLNPIFGSPVTEEIAPAYYESVTRPMDFSTIRRRMKKYPDYYKRPEVFAADVQQIWENVKLYNKPDVPPYRAGIDLHRKFKKLYSERFPNYPLD